MDMQAEAASYSAFYSLDNTLQNVSQDLVYDPITKQLCIRSHSAKNVIAYRQNIKNDDSDQDAKSNSPPTESPLGELRKQSDSDSGYCGLSSDLSIENGFSKSNSETHGGLYSDINENVDDLDLSQHNDTKSRLDKSKVFLQSVLTKFTSTIATNYDSNEPCSSTKQLGHSNSFSSTASSSHSISDSIDDNAFTLIKRPPNLPPKSEAEERKHQAEFEEILKQAKKREQKALKIKKRILCKKFRQEEEISGAIRAWTNDVLPSWPSLNSTKRVKELWWSGIPSPIRPKVWSLAIGNDLRITDELFRICVERSKERIWTKQFTCRRSSNPYPSSTGELTLAKHHRRVSSQPIANKDHEDDSLCMNKLAKKLSDASIEEGAYDCAKLAVNMDEEEDEEDSQESTSYLIKLDVSRTFPQLGLFQEDSPYHQSLSDVLAAYAVYRPDLGYCQGMSFLAAMLLLNLDSPVSAFTAFANLLNNELLLCFYRLNQDKMQQVYAYYDRQLHSILPRLASHFKAIGLSIDLFLVDQVYSLFARSLPLDCVCRVWDMFLRDGDQFIFRASLGILVCYEEHLLACEFVQVAQFLSRLPEEMHIDKYFEAIASVRLTPPRCFHDQAESGSLPLKSTDTTNLCVAKKLLHLR